MNSKDYLYDVPPSTTRECQMTKTPKERVLAPIDMAFAKAKMRCTICEQPTLECLKCWEQCSCGWSALRGFQCNNPDSKKCSTKVKYATHAKQSDYTKARKDAAKRLEGK